jgi:hypothetical protein
MKQVMSAGDPTCREEVQELAKELGYPEMTLRVLSHGTDPFFCGTEGQRQLAEWFASLYRQYRGGGTFHIRRLHYRLVSLRERPTLPGRDEAYENTERHYAVLNDASRYARHLGLVDPAEFTDRRNPPHKLLADYALPDGYCDDPDVSASDDRDWRLPRYSVAEASFPLPGISALGYDYCLRDQAYHLEVWIEKSTMNDLLVPVCQRHGANLVTGVGFQSISSTVHTLRRIKDLPDDRPTQIGYISDFDPAGDCMPVAVARMIEFYIQKYAPGRDIKLTPIGLTRQQADRHDLPRIPIKGSDPRKGSFQSRRGQGAVELDALEALVPGELGRMVEGFMAPYRDAGLEGRLREARDEAQAAAEAAWEEATEALREKLRQAEEEARAIVARYDQDLRSLNYFLAKDLALVQAQLDEAGKLLSGCVEQLDVSLPDRPEAEVGEVDDSDWLYDSERDFTDQLDAYEAFKGRLKERQKHTARREEYHLNCTHCGKEFQTARRRKVGGVVYCGNKCRIAAHYKEHAQTLTCAQCGKEFQAVRPRKPGEPAYCDKKCSKTAYWAKKKAAGPDKPAAEGGHHA